MKQYIFNYSQGVQGNLTAKREIIFAENEREANRQFNSKFASQINSKGLDKVNILLTTEHELPELTEIEFKTALTMFPNSENPVLQYKQYKSKWGAKQ